MKQRRKWLHAQKEELSCWVSVRDKVLSREYIELKKEYWRKLLAKAGISERDLTERRVLEAGCGPSGISLLLPDRGRSDSFVINDPLLDEYRGLYPDHFGRCIEVQGPFESLPRDLDGKFDYIFAINVLDHCEDIPSFLRRLHSLSRDDTVVVIGVNTHVHAWSQKLWRALQRVLEPHHPHHYTVDGYGAMFGSLMRVEKIMDIEDEVADLNMRTRAEKTTLMKIRSLAGLVKPANLLIRILDLCGYPLHDFDGRGRSIYRHKLFIMKKRAI